MIFRLVILQLLIVFFMVSSKNISFAQDDIPDDVIVGGEAKCIIKGKTPIKSGVTDGNRLLLLQDGGFTKGSIVLQRVAETNTFSIDAYVLALFGEITDLDGFLSGKELGFEDSNSDLTLKKTNKINGTTIEVSNIIDNDTKGNLKGAIKVISSGNGLASGKIKLLFERTTSKITKDGDEKVNNNNGSIGIKCKFRNVPLAIKELDF